MNFVFKYQIYISSTRDFLPVYQTNNMNFRNTILINNSGLSANFQNFSLSGLIHEKKPGKPLKLYKIRSIFIDVFILCLFMYIILNQQH